MNSVKLTKTSSNLFDMTHDKKLSCEAGYLIPTLCEEAVPGDKWNISIESIVRLAPMLAPVMHRFDIFFHVFFCPTRIVWENFDKYISNEEVGGVLPAYPTINYIVGDEAFRLTDYLGLPNTYAGWVGRAVSAVPFACYQKIYNEYYRDQNLINEVNCNLADGDNAAIKTELCTLRKRAWEHDYFTSALPEAQKGDPVELPLGNFQDVPVKVYDDTVAIGTVKTWNVVPGVSVGVENEIPSGAGITEDELYADTSSLLATATTINDLRTAFRIQEWLEKAMRGGSRYIETILVHFGVRSSDKRLQRPEYITGTKSPITISEVLNTSGTATEPQGNMAGHGVGYVSGNRGGYFCEEHGYIIGIMSIMPKTAYQQGIPKHFLKTNNPYELYWPTFANLGEQEVVVDEIYAGTANGDDVFGYLPRYAEYRTAANTVHGEFRTSLNYWHLGRIFAAAPPLNQDFVECNPDTRIFAVEGAGVDHYYVQVLNRVYARRLMPKFGTPTF